MSNWARMRGRYNLGQPLLVYLIQGGAGTVRNTHVCITHRVPYKRVSMCQGGGRVVRWRSNDGTGAQQEMDGSRVDLLNKSCRGLGINYERGGTTIQDCWFYLRADGLVYIPTNLHAVKSKQTWRTDVEATTWKTDVEATTWKTDVEATTWKTDVESWRGELTWRQRYGIIDKFGKVPVRSSGRA